MELPVPRHLKKILQPIGENNSEFKAVGKLVCECGNIEFQIYIVGDPSDYKEDQIIKVAEIKGNYFLIIKAECCHCQTKYLVFDNDYHGWNGYVCGGDNREAERPVAQKWNCYDCKNGRHKMTLTISSHGKKDFLEEGGEEFGEENWAEGFGWLTIETQCTNCNKKNPEWISYETM